jgi:hypothetical protein
MFDKRLLILCLSLTVGAGCFKHMYTVGTGGNVGGSPAYDRWHSHWIFGLFGEDNIDVRTVCPSGNATIKDEHSFLNLVIASLVGVLWYPTSVEIYCDGRSASLQVSPRALERVGRDPRLLPWARAAAPSLAVELQAVLEAGASGRSVAISEAASPGSPRGGCAPPESGCSALHD